MCVPIAALRPRRPRGSVSGDISPRLKPQWCWNQPGAAAYASGARVPVQSSYETMPRSQHAGSTSRSRQSRRFNPPPRDAQPLVPSTRPQTRRTGLGSTRSPSSQRSNGCRSQNHELADTVVETKDPLLPKRLPLGSQVQGQRWLDPWCD